MDHLIEKLSGVSTEPGVYLMKNRDDRVIYVGKAKNLKKRLASYFKSRDQLDLKTGVLVNHISNFETIITRSENDALILESNLIKKHRPRYNVILKDGKRYPSLRLDINQAYPNLEIVRKVKQDGALYFGPYTAPGAMYQTLKLINKHFKLRKCKAGMFRNRTRPCLNYQIGMCLGPCCLDVDPAVYREIVNEVVMFLKGRTPELLQKVKRDMASAAADRDFEKAAELRDRMFALERTVEQRIAVTTDFQDRDIIGLAGSPERSVITVLSVRSGYLNESRHFKLAEALSTDGDIIESFIRQHYERVHFIPKEILIPIALESADLIEKRLTELKGRKVSVLHPQRGEKVRLLEMADQNAADALKEWSSFEAANRNILLRLQRRLRMDRLPNRIECFDNSNISGTSPVAGMVVFEAGKPLKSAYRKYKIKTVREQDDYAYMAEALKRRYGRRDGPEPFPDLLMVDGGKGQLNIAVSILADLDLSESFQVIGIAKKDTFAGETEDKIYLPGRANPVRMAGEGEALFFLQRIRDEAHRFAVSFHRNRRSKAALGSALDSVPGIGGARKKALLKHFGSAKKIRAATLEELSAVPGISGKLAEMIQTAIQE